MGSSKVTVYRFEVYSPISRTWLHVACYGSEQFIASIQGRKLDDTAIEIDAAQLNDNGQYFHPASGHWNIPPALRPSAPKPAAAPSVERESLEARAA